MYIMTMAVVGTCEWQSCIPQNKYKFLMQTNSSNDNSKSSSSSSSRRSCIQSCVYAISASIYLNIKINAPAPKTMTSKYMQAHVSTNVCISVGVCVCESLWLCVYRQAPAAVLATRTTAIHTLILRRFQHVIFTPLRAHNNNKINNNHNNHNNHSNNNSSHSEHGKCFCIH